MAKQKSDLSRAFSEDGALKTHIGGQALLEGIMMRGKVNWAAAVRKPDGTIYVEEHDLTSGKKKNKWMTWPLVRGCVALVESLGLGYKALSVATENAFDRYDMSYAAYLQEGLDPVTATPEERMRAAGWDDDEVAAGLAELEAEAAGEAAGAESPAATVDAAAVQGAMPAAVDAGAVDAAAVDAIAVDAAAVDADEAPKFSWKNDFGNPDEMVDALGAQRKLEIVTEPAPAGMVTPEASAATAGQDAAGAGAEKGTAVSATSRETGEKGDSNFADGVGKGIMSVSMVVGVVLGIVLFIVAPAFVTNLIVGEYDNHTILWNVVDGILRVGIFVLYLWLIGRMKDIKRMFAYHGAEHKTIHCFEHGLELTPENCRKWPRLHVRCGTAFLIMVMILAILVYTIIPVNALISAWGVPDGAPKLVLVIVVRIIFMPLIAGIAYEVNVKWAGTHPDNPLVKVILWPGMQMQYLTTNEPDDSMLECAIAATKRIIAREERAVAEGLL